MVQFKSLSRAQREEELDRLEMQMKNYAKDTNFEAAAEIRDIIMELKAVFYKKKYLNRLE